MGRERHSDRDRKILLAIVPLVVLVAYWFLLLAPKREEASTAAHGAAKQEQRLDDGQGRGGPAAKAPRPTSAADYTEIVRLGKAIPAQRRHAQPARAARRAAAGTGIRFTKIATGERDAAPPRRPATAATTPAGRLRVGTTHARPRPAASPPRARPAAPPRAPTTPRPQSNQAGDADAVRRSPTDTQTSTSTGGGLPIGGGRPPTATAAAAPAGLETVPLELEFVGDFFNLADFFHDVKRFVHVANRTCS